MESAVRYDFSFPPKSSSLNSNSVHQMQSSLSSGANGSCGMSTHLSSHGSGGHSVHHSGYSSTSGAAHHSHHQHHGRSSLHGHGHVHGHEGSNHQNNYSHQSSYNSNTAAANAIGLSKSASTSLLSCVTNNNVNNNNNNNNNYKSCNNNYCNSCSKDCNTTNVNNNNVNSYNNKNSQYCKTKNTPSTQYTILSNHQQTSNNTHLPTPATPKDGNCSFTFDDLKNTLSFMDDSPLINTNTNQSTSSNVAPPSSTSVLMVIAPSGSASSGECASAHSASSSSSCASSSSCNSYNGFMSKSNSNPMLLNNTSPVAHPKSDCGCSGTSSGSSSGNTSTATPLDLLIKKSPSNLESNQQSHPHFHNSSLIQPAVTALPPGSSNLQLLSSQQQQHQHTVINNAIETAAKKYRCAAQVSEATCCWKGKLPPKQYKTPIVYSTKVFVGGLPWDITEEDLVKEFGVFGPCRVEWTNKEKYNLLSSGQHQAQLEFDSGAGQSQSNFRSHRSIGNLQQLGKQGGNNSGNNNNNANNNDSMNSSKQRMSPGFAYVIYDSEYSVRSLVGNCIEDYQNGRDRVEYYFKISTRRVRNKEVQIIPWILADNNFALCTPKELDPKKTVFVGNLHGTMTARDLAHIMNELFGCVVYAGIDIDKLKYPIGSGRVTFSHQQNFMRAVRAAFVDIQSSKFSKRIQIDPYLEDVQCCACYADKGIYFCRDFQCFNYYCGVCWEKQHSFSQMGNHKPLMRKREDK